MKLPLVAGVLCLLWVAGCAVGPNYKTPDARAPAAFRGEESSTTNSLGDLPWWQLFQDPDLQALIQTALTNNYDLRVAVARVEESRALLAQSRSQFYPQVSYQGASGGSRNVFAGAPFDSGSPSAKGSYLAGSVSWEIDLWGRLRRLNEAARAQYLATEEAQRGVTISLISDVMTNYFALREADLELEISQRTSGIATDNLRLINLRHDRGAANGLDVYQAEQFLYTATAQIANVKRSIGQTEDALSLLLGSAPEEVPRGKELEQIAHPATLPAGLPSSLLDRRPDIRQAEQNLIAANAEIGAARALLFPQISLTGFLGGQSQALTSLLSGPARVASIAPSLLAPIFHAGLRAGVRLTEAQQRESLLDYQQTIYGALREVSDAIVAHDRTHEQRAEEEKLVAALTESVRLSNLRYRGGLDSYLQVLDAERNLFGGQLTLAQLRLEELQAVAQLYRALGGGWQ